MQEVLDTLREMQSIFRDEIKMSRELHGWLTSEYLYHTRKARLERSSSGFKLRCVEMLESQGDSAMQNKDYDNAVTQYSAALDINPAVLRAPALFLKRSEARAALCSWEDALKDADEVCASIGSRCFYRIQKLVSIRQSD